MAQISLRNRIYGPWAGFEREVLASEHAGWARYVGRRRVQLRKSPFLPPDPTREYLLPEDVVVDEEELVELTVGNQEYLVRSLPRGSAIAEDYVKLLEVVAVTKLRVPLPRPYLDTDEFLSRVIVNWRAGEEDHLDKSIALQLLSCPRTAIGPGGIGSQSFDLSGAPKVLDRLKRSVDLNLPAEFSRPNPRYEMDFLSSLGDLSALRKKVVGGQVEEVSYNYLKMVDPSHHPLPQHVPTIVYNSTYRPVTAVPDPDVIEFQLYGLWLRPVVTEAMIARIEKMLGSILEESDPTFAGYNIDFDQDAMAKIAMALCRLYRQDRLDEDMLSRSRRWFMDLYRFFADLRLNYVRPGGSSRISIDGSPEHRYLRQGPHDMQVLREIYRGVNEVGLDYVSFAGLKKALRRKKLTADEIRDSITRLVQSGSIISKENDNLFRPVRRFELDLPERK
ncbi:MAG: hypothetical protein SA339_10995 [Methanomassiliicoccus sp.]|nr:hypothetical protein [Methanomassiliicoccus sp.]